MRASAFLSLGGERFAFPLAGSFFPIRNACLPRSIFHAFVARLTLSVLAVAMGQSLPAIVTASDELESIPEADKPRLLERIRLELTEYQASIDSIDVKWTRRSLADPAQVPKVMPFERKQWLRSGRRQSLVSEALMSLDAPVRHRSYYSFDGEHGYALSYHRSDPSQLDSVTILNREIELFAVIDVPYLLGWKFCALPEESLASMLAKPEARLAGKREVHGDVCYEVEVGKFPKSEGPDDPELILAWIDPKHSWLARRIRICPEAAYRDPVAYAKKPGPRLNFWECQVKTFQEVSDPLQRRTVFFPKEAEIARDYAITVDDVKLNPPLPASIFRPEIPDGVEVVEQRGAAHYERTVTGGEAAKAEHARLREADLISAGLRQPMPELLSSPTPIDARPHPGSSLPSIMLCTSVLAFAAAFGFLVNRLRHRS